MYLPPLNSLHLQMHPLPRLRRHRPRNRDLLLRILHLKLEPPSHTGDRTPQFRPRKVFPNTRSLAVQERDLRKVCRRTTVVVGCLSARFRVRVDPALGEEFVAIRAPEFRAPVDCVGAQDDPGALGNVFSCHDGVTDGFTDCGGDRGEEAEHFLTDTVEEREGFEVGPGYWVVR